MTDSAVLTVGQLNALVGNSLAKVPALDDVLVEGEVSNLSRPSSGHLYFTLKDAGSQLRCVSFRTQAMQLRFRPENGMVVVAHGRVGVYEQGGQYQLYVDRLDPTGVGALAKAVEQLRHRLAAEGLFDERAKRPLPLLPKRVAVISSPTGAAVRDAITVLTRRAPAVDVVLVPTPVQGDGAAGAIVLALRRAQELGGVEVILLVRGGGSFEDLHAFQDEAVVRAIRASVVPVVTGVGHETDTTLADWAADHRAATPSVAAETAVPDQRRMRDEVGGRVVRLAQGIRQGMAVKRSMSGQRALRLTQLSPAHRLGEMRQLVDVRNARLRSALRAEVVEKRRRLEDAAGRLRLLSPARRVDLAGEGLRRREQSLRSAHDRLLALRRAELSRAGGRLEALSPNRIIERGYSMTVDAATGVLITSAAEVRHGQMLRTRLATGEVRSVARLATGGDPEDGPADGPATG